MPKLTITPLAVHDLKNIGRYTEKNWGKKQRNAYLENFAILFEKIRTSKIVGRNRDTVRQGLLCYPCQKHLVFFKRGADGGVDILRILHQSMDFDRHL